MLRSSESDRCTDRNVFSLPLQVGLRQGVAHSSTLRAGAGGTAGR